MTSAPQAFWHRSPVISVEFEAKFGWDIVLLYQHRREYIRGFGTIEPAIDFARDIAEANEFRFVPGAARSWLRRVHK